MFDGTNPSAYAAAKVKVAGSLKDAADARFGAGDPKVVHFQNDWLGGAYHWGNLKPEETLKAGLTQAITKAQGGDPTHPKPMEFIWVCARDKAFHVYYCDGPRQVTVIIFTPPPLDAQENPTGGAVETTSLTNQEPIWVVKKQENYDTSGGYPGPVTQLTVVGPPQPATIIERQIFDY
jgi:hypothetical protein